MNRLLVGCPYTRPHVVSEAAVDIPPLVRRAVWPQVLDVSANIGERYAAIDKVSDHPTDRQIEVS